MLAGMVRVEGIEPSTQAWEARVLPLNHTRIVVITISEGIFRQGYFPFWIATGENFGT